MPSPEAPVLAAPRRRLAAALIDGVICALLGSAAWIPAVRPHLHQVAALARRYPGLALPGAAFRHVIMGSLESFAVAALASAAIAVTYYWLATGLTGSTPGKRAAGIRVISQDTWRRPRLRAAFYRAVVFIASPVLFGVFPLADAGWLLLDPRRQCLHDKAVRTLVVNRH